ncbi:MAG: DNA repair protein RecO [Gammaproteobacteria bacterium]
MTSLQPCFVLHQRAYRETSSLIEIYAEHAGRLGLVAKGARRPRSPFRGLLQPFVPLLLSWSGRGELGTLTGAEFAAPPPRLQGAQVFQAMYLNELLMRLLHRHDPHPQLYVNYSRALDALAATPAQGSEAVLRRFEVALLDAIGYGMVLDHAVDTERPIRPDGHYRYLAQRGPVEQGAREAAAGELHTAGLVHDASAERKLADDEAGIPISGRALLWLAGGVDEGSDIAPQAKQLMRFVLRPLLGERPLATRMLFTRPGSARALD